MLRYTGGAIPTTQGHPTTKPSTTVRPTGGGLDSPAPGQQEGQFLVLFSSYTDYFNSFPVQISHRSFKYVSGIDSLEPFLFD